MQMLDAEIIQRHASCKSKLYHYKCLVFLNCVSFSHNILFIIVSYHLLLTNVKFLANKEKLYCLITGYWFLSLSIHLQKKIKKILLLLFL